MKFYRYYLKANRRLLLYCLGIMLSIDLLIFAADMSNAGIDGYLTPILISLGLTIITMLLLIAVILRKAKKFKPFLELYDKKGPCPETIQMYISMHPKPRVIDYVSIAAYYNAAGDVDNADRFIATAGTCVMVDIRTRAYYVQVLLSIRIRQRRFQEAAVIFNNYNSMMTTFCKSNPGPVALDHYGHAALMYAMSGNINAALEAIGLMERSIRRDRQLAFTRNTALMAVYLIGGDLRRADDLKEMMIKDVREFDGFLFESNRDVVLRDIQVMQELFDPRMKQQ